MPKNESLLNTFQCDWNSVNFIKLDNIRGQRVTQWREKALALIQDHYPADGNFVIKDPKFSLLIPFWQEVFNELEIGTRFLLTYRPPLSVAASLKARNGFSREKSVLIWLAYYHACLKTIPQASPVSVVSYDLFMQHPVDQSKRITAPTGHRQRGLAFHIDIPERLPGPVTAASSRPTGRFLYPDSPGD